MHFYLIIIIINEVAVAFSTSTIFVADEACMAFRDTDTYMITGLIEVTTDCN